MHERIEEIRHAIETFARAMAEHKDRVVVTVEQHGPQIDYKITVAQADMPRLVGSLGSNFNSLSSLVWSLGNLTPQRLKTRLLKIEPHSSQPAAPADDVDPSDLFTAIAVEMGLPSLFLVSPGQMRGVIERAGANARDIRAYLLAMRKDDLAADTARMLNNLQGY